MGASHLQLYLCVQHVVLSGRTGLHFNSLLVFASRPNSFSCSCSAGVLFQCMLQTGLILVSQPLGRAVQLLGSLAAQPALGTA